MLILASASPRRKELISLICDDVRIIPADVDESIPTSTKPEEVAELLAIRKAEHIAKQFPRETVIGCDTTVIVDNTILGKPKDADDARRMLSLLSGKSHTVITGCAICKDGHSVSFSQNTQVTFYSLSEEEIADYISTGEPMDKAGAYGIQGKGSLFVKEISGDYFNVVGMPIARLNKALLQMKQGIG